MKPTIRSRKVVLGSVRPEQPKLAVEPIGEPERNIKTPLRVPSSRVILRNNKEKDVDIPKVVTDHAMRHSQIESESENGDNLQARHMPYDND